MKVSIAEGCDKHCLATDTLINLGTEVTDLEDNALENGIDVIGGEIACSGPRYIADKLGEVCVFQCCAKCDVPALDSDVDPVAAVNIQGEIKNVLSQAFEIPSS